MAERKYIEILDTTLRDGEQTSGVSFLPHEKLSIARMLLKELNVNRIEVASARVSEGEKDAVRMIAKSAEQDGMLDRVEVLDSLTDTSPSTGSSTAGAATLISSPRGAISTVRDNSRKHPTSISPISAMNCSTPNQRDSASTSISRTGAEV